MKKDRLKTRRIPSNQPAPDHITRLCFFALACACLPLAAQSLRLPPSPLIQSPTVPSRSRLRTESNPHLSFLEAAIRSRTLFALLWSQPLGTRSFFSLSLFPCRKGKARPFNCANVF